MIAFMMRTVNRFKIKLSIKVGRSPFKTLSALMKALKKMMKNAFYFILESLFALSIYRFLS